MTRMPAIKAQPRGRLPRPVAESLPVALAALINRGSFHGSWLPLRTAAADNVALAERALRRAEAAGWIARGKYDPWASREFMFFGVGGFRGDRLPVLSEEHRSALCFHWIASATRGIEPADVEAALHGAP